MTAATATSVASTTTELELATFYIGEMLIGIDIRNVCEINRNLELTCVPPAADGVRGVINLRGDVVTVLALRVMLDLESQEFTRRSRNIVISSEGEQVGLVVDSVSDVISADSSQLDPPPGNLNGVDDRFFSHVIRLESELLLVLDPDELLGSSHQ